MAELLGQSPQAYNSYTSIYGDLRRGYTAISPAIAGSTLEYIIIKAARRGTSGNVTIKVYDTAYASNAELAALANGTIISLGSQIGTVTVDSSGWSTASANRTFTFGAAIDLPSPNELIIFTVEHPTGDSSNCIRWGIPTGSAYTRAQSIDGGTTWTKETGSTGIYQTWGTRLSAPEQPKTPVPGNAVTNVTLDQATLTWEDGTLNGNEATSYDVYFGDNAAEVAAADNTDETGIYRGNQVETSFTITDVTLGSPFDYLVARYWRIDAVNDAGITTGVAWSFVCMAFAPPLPTGVTLNAEGEPTGTPTGENNMITVRRLVVAANDKIWYEDV